MHVQYKQGQGKTIQISMKDCLTERTLLLQRCKTRWQSPDVATIIKKGECVHKLEVVIVSRIGQNYSELNCKQSTKFRITTYFVTPGVAPTQHAFILFRLFIILLFPVFGKPAKNQLQFVHNLLRMPIQSQSFQSPAILH